MWIWVKIGGEELLTASLSDCGADGWNPLDGFRLLFSEKAKLLNAGLLFAWGAIHIVSLHNFGLFLAHPRQQNCS